MVCGRGIDPFPVRAGESGLDRVRREWCRRSRAWESAARCLDAVQQIAIFNWSGCRALRLNSERQKSASLRTTSGGRYATCDNGDEGKGVGRR